MHRILNLEIQNKGMLYLNIKFKTGNSDNYKIK